MAETEQETAAGPNTAPYRACFVAQPTFHAGYFRRLFLPKYGCITSQLHTESRLDATSLFAVDTVL